MSKKNKKYIKHFVVAFLFAITLWYAIGLHGVADRRDMTLNEWPVVTDDSRH